MKPSESVYGTATQDEPTAEELEAARLGFMQMLRRKRLSARFIEANAEDLLARARFEYTRAIRRGDQIRKPAGWIIHCAWRRTQNRLEAEGHEPQMVSTEKAAEVVDASPTPEQALLRRARAEAIEIGMEALSHDQRTLIELSYFEGLSVREAGRFLGWHSSKAQRTHESALRKLREALGITDVDELAIEIGLAAWVSLSGTKQVLPALPSGIEAVTDAGQRGVQGLWARGQELARRVVLGGSADAPGAMAASGGARAAGVCGAAAIACLAGGVVGPGVGGITDTGEGPRDSPPAKVRAAEPPVAATAETADSVAGSSEDLQSGKFGAVATETKETKGNESGNGARSQTPEARTESEFDAFASGSATGESAAPAPASSRPSGESGAPSPPTAGEQSAGREFGAFE